MNRIHDSLHHVFQRHRLVFWYDPEGQWTDTFESFDESGIHRRRIEGTEFGVKVAIHRDPDPQARYLLYFPSARPPDANNWLLDLLLQGHEYQADRASLALQEVGLPYEFLPVVAQHIAFFHSTQRAQAFQKLLTPDEDPPRLRLKMMAVLAGTAPDLDALLLRFLTPLTPRPSPPRGEGMSLFEFDLVEEGLGPARLVESFWQMVGQAFAYRNEHPTLRDFAATLFRWANPLDAGVMLDPHAQVFLQRWQDSATHGPSFRAWATLMEAELHVAAQLEALDDPKRIEAADTFPAFEKFFIHRLCRVFEAGVPSADLLPILQQRRQSFWYPDHADGYQALEQAITLRDGIAAADLTLDSLDAGLARYVTTWHRIDTAYRRFCHHLRRYNQVALMERIADWVEKTYVNSFLLPLADRWSDQIRGLTCWGCQQLPPQTDFFARFVQPYLDKGQKVIVVVSDALRFEAAAEFAARLRAENRWTAEVHAMLGVLPSYT